jgi:hypothetical protein
MNQTIKKFAILGERCSGTNFLEESMSKNFSIQYTAEFGSKHFFCYNNYDDINKTNDTLFIGIIRNPVYWINSFSKELYHVPQTNRKKISSFLFNEFYSVKEPEKSNNTGNALLLNNNLYQKESIIPNDLNYLNGQKYKNIFELRKVKNHFLINVMPKKVKNYILINYEDLLYNFDIIMKLIKEKFSLIQTTKSFERSVKYKKSDSYNFVKQRDVTLPLKFIHLIWRNLDLKQEKSLGYLPFDDNKYFIMKFKSLTYPSIQGNNCN